MPVLSLSDFHLVGLLETFPVQFLSAGCNVYESFLTTPYRKLDDLCELIYVRQGRAEAWLGGKRYGAQPGCLITCLPGTPHKLRWQLPEESPTTFSVRFRCLFDADERLRMILPPAAPILRTDEMQAQFAQLFLAMIHEYDNQSANFQQICDCLLDTLLLRVCRLRARAENLVKRPSGGELGLLARAYIERNYAGALSIRALADALYASPSHLSHVFRKTQGASPMQYLGAVRVERAKVLLRATDLPVLEIAQRVGFENTPSFDRLFRQKTGMTPTQYRRRKLLFCAEDEPPIDE